MLCNFIVLYILATLAIGLFVSKFIKNPQDFALAGKRMPMFVTASALFATWFGSETIMGASSEFLEHGLIGVIEDPFGAALCLILLGLFFAKALYNLDLITLGDLFAKKYGGKVEIIAAFFLIFSYFGWTAAQLIAFALVLKTISGVGLTTGIWIAGVLVLIYTYAGGMWAITVTDFMQTIVIIVGLSGICWKLLIDAGGITQVVNNTPPGFWRFLPENDPQSIMDYIAAWITIGLGSIPQQDVFQRVMSAKSARTAQLASLTGGLMYLTIAFLPLIMGLCAKQLYPNIAMEDGQTIITQTVMMHGTLWMQVLFYGALLSAIMSTASGSILAPATTLAENIFKPLLKNISQNQLLVLMRISVVIITLIGIWLANGNKGIFELVSEASSISLVTLFAPFVAGLWWKGARSAGALVSMFGGLAAWMILERWPLVISGITVNPLIAATLISFLGMWLGSFIHRKVKDPLANL